MSVDTGTNNCGICVGEFGKPEQFGKYALTLLSQDTKSLSDGTADDKIESMGDYLLKVIKLVKPKIILAENPAGGVAYGRGSIGVKLKRANDLCKLRCMLWYTKGMSAKDESLEKTPEWFFVEPGDWQDRKAIKRHGNSKEWSMSEAMEMFEQVGIGGKVTEHAADAAVMMKRMIEFDYHFDIRGASNEKPM